MPNDTHNLKCPACNDTDNIDISVNVWARIIDDGTDVDASHDGSVIWDNKNPCYCASCHHLGFVSDFQTKE